MGQIRVAKDGHLYEYRWSRRTGRYYTVQHTKGSGLSLVIGLFFGPWTLFVALAFAAAIGWPTTLLLWLAALAVAIYACHTSP